MTRADLPDVIRIIRLHDTDDGRVAHQALSRHFKQLSSSESDRYWVARGTLPAFDAAAGGSYQRRDQVVGVSGYFEDPHAVGVVWLGWTYVHPSTRGRGVGGRLVDRVTERVRSLSARIFMVSTSDYHTYEAAQKFYESNGFDLTVTLQDYYAPGESRLLYTKGLSGTASSSAWSWTSSWHRDVETDDVYEAFVAPVMQQYRRVKQLVEAAPEPSARILCLWLGARDGAIEPESRTILETHGYEREGEIGDYYATGHDVVIWVRRATGRRW